MGFPLLVLEVSFLFLPSLSDIVQKSLCFLIIAQCSLLRQKTSLCVMQMSLGSWLFTLFCSGCYGHSLQ